MEIKNLIEILDVKEKQAFAYIKVLNGKVSINELQQKVDNYCKNMAIAFLDKYKLDNKQNLALRKHIISIGADKKYSGHRFYEILYKELNKKQAKEEYNK